MEVCHKNGSGFEVLRVTGEADLQSHLEHGDEVFGVGLDESCQGAVTFHVDSEVSPRTAEVSGLRGGAPRQVGALVGPDGGRDEFVENEIEAPFESERDLENFLAQYGGTILMDDIGYFVDDDGVFQEVPGGADGWRLIRIDPSRSNLSDLPALAQNAGLSGDFAASSDAALRLLALHLREADRNASANFVAQPDALLEHPLADPAVTATYWDMSTEWWMTDDDSPSLPGDQGLSIGVARAQEYLRHTGYPPRNGTWTPARVAIIDQGFDLDEVTGLGNRDYTDNSLGTPLQIDLQAMDNTAGGIGLGAYGWHGQGAFGVCCAAPRNAFGGAGTGGEYVRPILIKFDATSAGTVAAVDSAMRMGAQVINMSFAFVCNSMCALAPNRIRQQQKFRDASDGAGIALFAGAGNGIQNDGQTDLPLAGRNSRPCELYGVICVGAIDRNGDNVWNWGDVVDIWAPTGVPSTVSPVEAAIYPHDWGVEEVRIFRGTSCSSPFAAGIAGMIKSVSPELPGYSIEQILKDTANQSSDAKVVTGYVDALRAVQTVRDNPAPLVDLSSPRDGATSSFGRPLYFSAIVSDPADVVRIFRGTVEFYSDVDGLICTTGGEFTNCEVRLASAGRHVITAVAIDDFGGSTTSDAAEITLTNSAPSVELVSPPNGAALYADQVASFRATVDDPDLEDFGASCSISSDVACAEWTSSLDGVLLPPPLVGNPLNFAVALSQGLHTITVTVYDAFGESSSASVIVGVAAGQGKPTARIQTPIESFVWSQPFVLSGAGTDPEDGTVSTLEWFSSVDGFLGTGSMPTVTLSGPECENELVHTITLRVTDSDGNVGTDELVVRFFRVC